MEATRVRRTATLAAATLGLALAFAAPGGAAVQGVGAPAGAPADYLKTAGLSTPVHAVRRDVVRLPAFDGEQLVHRDRPAAGPPGASR